MVKNSAELIDSLRTKAAAAKEERAKIDAIFSSIGEGLIATDENGSVTRINQVALDMLGYKESEVIGEWYPEKIILVNEDGSVIETIERPMTQVFMTGKAVSSRKYYQKKNGTIFPVFITVSPIFLKGKPIGAIEVFRDISTEMQNDRMKTEFIAIASHQLRTPLSAVNTYSLMLNQGYGGKLNREQVSFLKVIMSATSRMNQLITTLLNITRLEAGNIAINSNSVRLSKLLKDMVAEFRPQIKKKKISLTITIEESIDTIKTDQLVVREIFTNLFSNALKYTPAEGFVEVNLSTSPSRVIFKVKDSGYGIPRSSQAKIYTKFFRATNILKTEVSGTGLGLYMVKILAEKINGEVWFESQEGKGSSFYFSIPKKGSVPKGGLFTLEAAVPETID